MITAAIILSVILVALFTLGLIRYFKAKSMTKSEAIERLRRSKQMYNRLSEEQRNSPIGRACHKSIIFLQNKVNAYN